MSSPEYNYSCQNWRAYAPCDFQKALRTFDCGGCTQFEVAEKVNELETLEFSAENLPSMTSLGIVEAGGLGSVLRTTALVAALRDVNADLEVRWFSNERGVELLKHVDGVEGLLIDDAYEDSSLITSLDGLINFETSDEAGELTRYAKTVAGFYLNSFGKFRASSTAFDLLRLQVDDDYRLEQQDTFTAHMLRAAGLAESYGYSIDISAFSQHIADKVMAESFNGEIPQTLVGLNIGTSEKGSLRRWSAEGFADLARMVTNHYPEVGVVILNGPDDTESIQNIQDYLEAWSYFDSESASRVKITPGDMEIGAFISLVAKLDLVVTGNTFGFHAAKSQKVPTVVISSALPIAELEIDSSDLAIDVATHCLPCFKTCESQETRCISSIESDLVFRAVQQKMDSVIETEVVLESAG